MSKSSKNKKLVITHGEPPVKYTLEFTKDTVRQAENMGLDIDELASKPMNVYPLLFRCAFLANHRWLHVPLIEEMFYDLPDRDKLLPKLIEMYNEPIKELVGMEENANKGKNSTWEASF
mgnify:CR=1 FL=1